MSKDFESLDQPLMVEIIRRRQSPQARSLQDQNPDGSSGTTLKEDLKKFLEVNGAEFADVNLLLGDDVIPSHKALLASR